MQVKKKKPIKINIEYSAFVEHYFLDDGRVVIIYNPKTKESIKV